MALAVADYITIWIGYANIFIATFITIYAYLFLKQTNEHKDRRPWDFLFVASVFYLVYQILNIMLINHVAVIGIDTNSVSSIFAFLYSGCVLLAFVSQHDLILRSQLILISKKDNAPLKIEKDVELKIGVGGKDSKKK